AAAAPGGATLPHRQEEYAVLAVQGPRSAEVLDALGLPTRHGYMSFEVANFGGVTLTVCRTGYTGEHGYELVVPAGSAGEVWDAVLAAGARDRVQACGAGARGTPRTRRGYPPHRQGPSR